ncbi:acyl-CoA dehydrogenase family member 11-like [Stylophora pistillata]|uniref:acyl-CoA dehydrogenase family member 11-like n=1 Tax=Stylophora pistillata TaxID=50429 RepID=UPI000C03E694|nr:acyl-CoA dehydrogenase family member 11-like [Stylophora pistillata]
MEYIKGRQFPDANLPGVPADQTKAIFEAAIRTLALLQSLDTDKLNLEGIGDKEDVLKQRMDMLFEAYKQTERKSIPKAHQLMEWLRNHKPNDDKKPVIHHEDFRISNILWHPEEAQALAVIDWEGACWGHPFEDLAFFCFPFHFPAALEFTPVLKIGKLVAIRSKENYAIGIILVFNFILSRSRFRPLFCLRYQVTRSAGWQYQQVYFVRSKPQGNELTESVVDLFSLKDNIVYKI